MRVLRYLIVFVLLVGATATAALYLAPESFTHAAIGLERAMSGLERKQVQLDDGTDYVYLEGGTGEPLLLLHGFGADKDNFTRVARHLTPHYRVIIPDHVGFGESSHPPQADYSPQAQASRLQALMRKLDVTQLHIGGNSMGGHIAITYAAQFPAEVKSLWLLDSGGVWSAPGNDFPKMVRETGVNPLMVRSEEDFARMFDYVMADPPFVPRPILNVKARERIRNFDLEQIIFTQVSADAVEERAATVAVPTLIVWGREDRALNYAAGELLDRVMVNSQLIIMDGVGHAPMLERPAQSAADYLQFRGSF